MRRYSGNSVRKLWSTFIGTAEISLPFAKLSSFQSLISRKQLREIEVQMVRAISFGWFADFGKTPTMNARPNRFILTNVKHPQSPYFFRPLTYTLLTPSPLPTGILYFPQFRSHQETKMAARRTQRSTSKISRENRGQ